MNAPPTADAGPDQFVTANTTVSLNGSGSSDPDGDALYYGWSQIGGPPVTLSGAGEAVASFVPTVPGVHTFRLAVHDRGSWEGGAYIGETVYEHPRDQEVAMDAAGNAIAVWREFNEAINIWANRYVAGVGWGTATVIDSSPGDAREDLQIAANPAGAAVAVWSQWEGSRWGIWANRYVAGVGWGTATVIDSNSGDAGSPHAAVDSSGNVIAVWQQSEGTRTDVWASRFSTDSGWGLPTRIETEDPGSAQDPRVSVDLAGNAFAVWHQSDSVVRSIWTNRFVVGSGWGIATVIESGVLDAFLPQVALDPAGNAVAVWHQSDGLAQSIWANRYAFGTGWGTPTLVESGLWDAWLIGGSLPPGSLWPAGGNQLAVDAAGNALVVWRQSDGTAESIWTNRYVVGAGWGSASALDTDSGDVYAPQLSVDPAGNAVVVWDYGWYLSRMWAKPYRVGVGWGAGVPILGGCGCLMPAVALDPSGYAIVVYLEWSEPANTNVGILADRLRTPFSWDNVNVTVSPPSNIDTYLYPMAGMSSYHNTWDSRTGCTASTHYACVDEDPSDEATTYVQTATKNEKESHLMTDLSIPLGYSDIDVTWEGRCQRSSSQSGGQIRHLVRETDGQAQEDVGADKEFTCPAGSWSTFTFFMEQSPGGGEWVPAEVNALQCGYVSSTDVSPNPRVTRVRCRVQVTYPPRPNGGVSSAPLKPEPMHAPPIADAGPDQREEVDQTGTITFVSDTTWEVSDFAGTFLGLAQNVCLNDFAPANCPAGATLYGYPYDGFTADLSGIPGATWIWAPGITGETSPAFPAEFFFSKVFNLSGVTTGTISVAADDFAEVRVNGVSVGTTGSVMDEPLAAAASSSLVTFDILPFLIQGTNNIIIRAANGNFGCGSGPYSCNPAGVVFGGSLKVSADPNSPPCPRTQGFWKNHPGAWPVTALELGVETYTQTELLALLRSPTRGDASLILAKQLIAAKLNVLNGADSGPIIATIADADDLFAGFAGKLPYGVKPRTSVGQDMVAFGAVLDSYNNGQLTGPCASGSAGGGGGRAGSAYVWAGDLELPMMYYRNDLAGAADPCTALAGNPHPLLMQGVITDSCFAAISHGPRFLASEVSIALPLPVRQNFGPVNGGIP